MSVFLVALLVRLLVVAGIVFIYGNSAVFPDAAFYNRLAVDVATGSTSDWTPYLHRVYETTKAFTLPLAGLYSVFGPLAWVGQLFVALLGAGTAGLTTRLGSEAGLGTRSAVVAGAIVALLPSQVLFSSLTLKDAAVWLVLVSLGLVVAGSLRTNQMRLLGFGATTVFLLAVMGHLRLHTLVVCLWAVAIAAWFGRKQQRVTRGVGAFLILLLLPLTFGLGPAGVGFITSAGSLEERRAANASRAETAFVPDQEQLAGGLSEANGDADAGDGNGNDGAATDVGDAEGADGASADPRGGFSRDISHLPYGVAVMLAAPFPWWGEGNARVQMAQFAMILWYPIVLFAIVGLFFAWRYRRAMAFPILVGGGMLLLYALAEGNFGTAYRHRGEFVWVVALLAAIGLMHTVNWIRDRRMARV